MNTRPLLLSVLAGAVASAPAVAAEWSAKPSMVWTVDHQSNRDLRPEEHDTQGAFVNVDLLLKRETGTGALSMSPHVQLLRYSDDSIADATNASLALAGEWRTELSTLSARVYGARESTLTSELIDTGFTRGDTIRDTRSVDLTWAGQVSERRVRQIQLSYADIGYAGEYERLLPGYRYPSVSLTERFAFSGRTALAVTGFGSELRSPDERSESRNYGMQLALERQFTPRTFAAVSLGVSRTDLGVVKQDGYVGELTLKRALALGEASLTYSHSVAASGRGVLVERDRAGLLVHRAVSPRLRARFELLSVRNDDIGVFRSGERHRYESADAGLDWRSAETWTLGWRIGAARADQPFGGQGGEGWRTSIQAWWSRRPWTISR